MPYSSSAMKAYSKRRSRRAATTIQRYARGRSARRVPKTLARAIKNISLKNSETKTSGFTDANIALYHNLNYYKGNLLGTQQGLRDQTGFVLGNRVGDEVIARGLAIKFHLSCARMAPNCIFKVFVFRYRTGTTLNDASFWCGVDGAGANMDRVVDMPNTEKIKILKSFVIQHQPNYCFVVDQGGAYYEKVQSTLRQIYIPLKNMRVKYDGENSPTTRFTDIGFAVLAYDYNTTLQTDVRGLLTYSYKFYFKDP